MQPFSIYCCVPKDIHMCTFTDTKQNGYRRLFTYYKNKGKLINIKYIVINFINHS